ncbi:MAG: inosine/xanthosine triphosphatase [Candidatus Aenigmarchaeota archaeon]|nr:inosine/xanthosine triphosphatase [Candidatus Aenigmarchaeota archaeon]
MELISIGSKNPVKIEAVKNAIKKIWPDAEVQAIEVESGVSNQPTSNDEAIKGASNRAKLSLQKTNADLGIGLEGCIADTEHGMFVSSWVVVIDSNGKIGIGGGGGILLPEKIATGIRKGGELGPLMDEFIGQHDVKRNQGTVGVLTNGLVLRSESFENPVIYALTKFISPQYYE